MRDVRLRQARRRVSIHAPAFEPKAVCCPTSRHAAPDIWTPASESRGLAPIAVERFCDLFGRASRRRRRRCHRRRRGSASRGVARAAARTAPAARTVAELRGPPAILRPLASAGCSRLQYYLARRDLSSQHPVSLDMSLSTLRRAGSCSVRAAIRSPARGTAARRATSALRLPTAPRASSALRLPAAPRATAALRLPASGAAARHATATNPPMPAAAAARRPTAAIRSLTSRCAEDPAAPATEAPEGKLVGRCSCGDVRLVLDADATPSHAPAYCHCNTCRAFHGSAFAMEAGFKLDRCEISGLTTRHETSPGFERLRCATCGTPCGGIHKKLGVIFAPAALFAAPGRAPPAPFRPTMHLFYSRRIVGDAFDGDGLAKHDELPP